MLLKIPDFTKPELENIKAKANFTEREEQLFDLRAQDKTHEECAEIMNLSLSTEKRAYKKVLAKIIRVI